MPKEVSLKAWLSALFKTSFSHRGKKKILADGEDGPQKTVGEVEIESSPNSDATSITRGSRLSFDANVSQQGPNLTTTGLEPSSIDGRVRVFCSLVICRINPYNRILFFQCQSPVLSQTRSNRQSMSKAMSGENFYSYIDLIKQQLADSIRNLIELKESLHSSTDVQRYDEAVESLEGATKSLATLKSKLSMRKFTGNQNRNSYILPSPDLKFEFEDTPFSMTIPGIEVSQKESTLEAVQESKESEIQEVKEKTSAGGY